MREGWKTKKLGEALIVERGGSPRPIQKFLTNAEDGLNWIKISDASASTKYIYRTEQKIKKSGLKKTRFVKEGDFLLSNSMSFGRPYILKTSGCIHDGWLVLKEREEGLLDKEYLYHLLCSPNIFSQFDKLAAGSTVRNLNISLVSSVSIPIPPIGQQQQIAQIIENVFSQIDKAKANLEQNLSNAQELFQSKLDAIFSQRGEGWEEKKLGEVTIKIGSGATPKGGQASYKESGISLIRSMNVHDEGFKKKNLAFIDEEQASRLDNVTLEKNDVLLNITGASVARCCVVPQEVLPARVNQHVAIIRSDSTVSPEFLHLALTSGTNKRKLLGIGEQGSTRQAITKAQLENFLISYPKNKGYQDRVVQEMLGLKAEIKLLHETYALKLATLANLKKSLLQKAFSGELNKR